jgi:hypothetical protein
MGRGAPRVAQRPVPLHHGRTAFCVNGRRQIAEAAVWSDSIVVMLGLLGSLCHRRRLTMTIVGLRVAKPRRRCRPAGFRGVLEKGVALP